MSLDALLALEGAAAVRTSHASRRTHCPAKMKGQGQGQSGIEGSSFSGQQICFLVFLTFWLYWLSGVSALNLSGWGMRARIEWLDMVVAI